MFIKESLARFQQRACPAVEDCVRNHGAARERRLHLRRQVSIAAFLLWYDDACLDPINRLPALTHGKEKPLPNRDDLSIDMQAFSNALWRAVAQNHDA